MFGLTRHKIVHLRVARLAHGLSSWRGLGLARRRVLSLLLLAFPREDLRGIKIILFNRLKVFAELLALGERQARTLIDLDYFYIFILACQHQFLAEVVASFSLFQRWIFLELLNSVGVPKSIESRLAA